MMNFYAMPNDSRVFLFFFFFFLFYRDANAKLFSRLCGRHLNSGDLFLLVFNCSLKSAAARVSPILE